MKFFALVAAASATIHDSCTMTWSGAADPKCAGTGEQCYDWITETSEGTSAGLMCGLASDCGKVFTWTDSQPTPVDHKFYAQCTGLSMAACTNNTQCDDKGGFQCAAWTNSTGSTTMGCAQKDSECGKNINNNDVGCTGLIGDTCTKPEECDVKANYKCGMMFNNQTLNYTSGSNKCVANTTCGASSGNNTVTVCYDTAQTGCNGTVGCTKPSGDNGDVACGYYKIGGTNLTSGGQCVDKNNCAAKDANQTLGKNTTYFGQDAVLVCGSVKVGLAMGAAIVSAYLAM